MKQITNSLLTKGEWKDYPSIYPFLNVIWKYSKDIPNLEELKTFIETGTHNGSNAEEFAKYFDSVYTVELYPEDFMQGYKIIREKSPHINFFSGNSPNFLKEILPTINERCLFLLDAHGSWSCPLMEELDAIKQFSSKNNHVIIIDDTSFFGRGGWAQKEEFEKKLLELNPNYKLIYTGLGNNILLVY